MNQQQMRSLASLVQIKKSRRTGTYIQLINSQCYLPPLEEDFEEEPFLDAPLADDLEEDPFEELLLAPFEEAPFLEAPFEEDLEALFEEDFEAEPFLDAPPLDEAPFLEAPPLDEAPFLDAPFEELFEAPLDELLPAAFFAVAMLFEFNG